MNLLDTLEGSLLENFFPKGWDMAKIDKCCSNPPESIFERQDFWHTDFEPVKCNDVNEFDVFMGHEIAMQIKTTRDEGRKLIAILPVGPMGMYKWVVYFLQEWGVNTSHVHCFNMDEWSDKEGNTMEPSQPGSFQDAMEKALYNPLGRITIPLEQRNFATRENLVTYPEKIRKLKEQGAKLIVVWGPGRVFHVAFWEPHFAADYNSEEEWKKQNYRIGAKLHPLTIEQNAITSFRSRTTLVPCYANTIGPGLFLQADWAIGGADGSLNKGMMWQGMSLWTTLRYSPSIWVTTSFMPTLPGKLFFVKELAGPMVPACN
jgi:glucosamine-6-phosphate deaminase